MEIRQDALIAVIGAGTMGRGIAQVSAAIGHPDIVIDPEAAALAHGTDTLPRSLAGLAKLGRISDEFADTKARRVEWSADVRAEADAALAIEAIVERLDMKRALSEVLARVMASYVILATNTSSVSVSAMADGPPNPLRSLGLHSSNPLSAVKLVETVAGAATVPATVTAAAVLMRNCRKIAVEASRRRKKRCSPGAAADARSPCAPATGVRSRSFRDCLDLSAAPY